MVYGEYAEQRGGAWGEIFLHSLPQPHPTVAGWGAGNEIEFDEKPSGTSFREVGAW